MINNNSVLFDIIDEYSVHKRKHYIILFGDSEKNCGFKYEQAFLNSVANHLRKNGEIVTMKTKKRKTIEEIQNLFETEDDEQFIVLYSGHGSNSCGSLLISDKHNLPIESLPENTILFTSSCKPYMSKNMRKNITIVGEKTSILYPHKPKKLFGVFADLNKLVADDGSEMCFDIRTY